MVSGLFLGNAFGQETVIPKNSGLDHPGIKWDWKIKADDYNFIVTTVSNYDMKNVTLNKDNKELILLGDSTHDRNIAEIEIPHNLIGGNLTVFQNDTQVSPLIINNGNTSLVVLKFNQTGESSTSIMGTTYLPEFAQITPFVMIISIIMMMIFTLKTRKF